MRESPALGARGLGNKFSSAIHHTRSRTVVPQMGNAQEQRAFLKFPVGLFHVQTYHMLVARRGRDRERVCERLEVRR